jgi:hypothetical protein
MVAHAGTNSVILGRLLGLEPQPWEWERFASDHASVTVLRSTRIGGGHIFSLQTFSDVSHLPPGLVNAQKAMEGFHRFFERYERITRGFNSIRDDTKRMVDQISDGRLDIFERAVASI